MRNDAPSDPPLAVRQSGCPQCGNPVFLARFLRIERVNVVERRLLERSPNPANLIFVCEACGHEVDAHDPVASHTYAAILANYQIAKVQHGDDPTSFVGVIYLVG